MNKKLYIGAGVVIVSIVGALLFSYHEQEEPSREASLNETKKEQPETASKEKEKKEEPIPVIDIESLDKRMELVHKEMEILLKDRVVIEQGEDFALASQEKLDDVLESIKVLSEKQLAAQVPISPDSPSGKVLNQPRTQSGLSESMLDNYERETGVTPQEIESLMQQ